jgi:stage II sporulation protein AA (anti-sigma F factor antagonist)
VTESGPQFRFDSDVESRNGFAITVLSLDGELDLGVLDILEEALAARDRKEAGVVVDLSELSFVDSAGIQALVSAHEGLEKAGTPSAFVVIPGSNVERILDMTGLLERLGSHPDCDSAVAAVVAARG